MKDLQHVKDLDVTERDVTYRHSIRSKKLMCLTVARITTVRIDFSFVYAVKQSDRVQRIRELIN